MTKLMQVYKCEVCGNMVTVLHEGAGTLVCCRQDMTLLDANTVDAAKEKHVPVIEKTGDGILVKVGSAPHPMEEKHYIEWIQLVADGVCLSAFLKPGDPPEKLFSLIFLRNNLLTYYQAHLKQKAFNKIVDCLAPAGILIIGSHENLPFLPADLQPFPGYSYVFIKRNLPV